MRLRLHRRLGTSRRRLARPYGRARSRGGPPGRRPSRLRYVPLICQQHPEAVFGGSVRCRRRSWWRGERQVRRRGRAGICPGAAGPCCSCAWYSVRTVCTCASAEDQHAAGDLAAQRAGKALAGRVHAPSLNRGTRSVLAPTGSGRLLLVSYLLAASLRCQASSVAGVTGKIPVQRRRGSSRASAANHTRSAGSYRTRLSAPAQDRVLVPQHQQLSILRHVPAE